MRLARVGLALGVALFIAAPAMAKQATSAQAGELVRLLGMDKAGVLTANAMLSQNPAMAALPQTQRTCMGGVISSNFNTVTARHLVTQLGDQGSEHISAWKTFSATPAGNDFIASFASQAEAMLPGGSGKPREPDPKFKAEHEAFAATPAFTTLISALGPQLQPTEQDQAQMLQQMQQRCGFKLPGQPAA